MVDPSKIKLAFEYVQEIKRAQAQAIVQILGPDAEFPNVVGMAAGIKRKTGYSPTGEPALLILVEEKIALSELISKHIIPTELFGMQTDVIPVGKIYAQPLTTRVRPAQPGYSIGHKSVTAGTIGAMVYDRLDNDTLGGHPGIPENYYILSNNHILAASNAAAIGDPILQPGPFDGGTDPNDTIGALAKFIPIEFYPDVPLASQNNLVDAAIATADFQNIDRTIFWIGHPHGYAVNETVDSYIGEYVKKTGRTSSFTTGCILAVNAMIDVTFPDGRIARFSDQILTSAMSQGGDSGSLVLTSDNMAVGLLFAGSSLVSMLNSIQNVQNALNISVAEKAV